MLVSAIIPTRSRPDELGSTLGALAGLSCEGEVLVVDNASPEPASPPAVLANGWPVRLLRLAQNMGAGARNVGAREASGDWLLMLDDDSVPNDESWVPGCTGAPLDVVAIGGDIRLPDGRREVGGLPEVFVGCGALIRRRAFLEAGGYDESFGYYGEETDLCARLIAGGGRIVHDPCFGVTHRRSDRGRDVARIVERLACNEPLTIHRYAPEGERDEWLAHTLRRRKQVARREGVIEAFEIGARRFRERAGEGERTPLTNDQWDRLVGRSFAREVLEGVEGSCAVRMPAGPPGKHGQLIAEELRARGQLVSDLDGSCRIVAGTLAPGAAIDAAQRLGDEFPAHRVMALSPFAEQVTSAARWRDE